MRHLVPLLLCLTLALAAAGPARADRGGGGAGTGSGMGGGSGGGGGGGDGPPDGAVDHDRARLAVERHQILPLQQVLAAVRARYAGRVIEVELERKHGRYLYELKLVTTDGRIVELEVDAATGVVTDGSGKRRNAGDD